MKSQSPQGLLVPWELGRRIHYMAEMIAFFFSTAIGGPETTAFKCRSSAKSSLFQLLISSNVHSRGVCGGNKVLFQVIKLPSEHTLITTRTIPLQRFSKATNCIPKTQLREWRISSLEHGCSWALSLSPLAKSLLHLWFW